MLQRAGLWLPGEREHVHCIDVLAKIVASAVGRPYYSVSVAFEKREQSIEDRRIDVEARGFGFDQKMGRINRGPAVTPSATWPKGQSTFGEHHRHDPIDAAVDEIIDRSIFGELDSFSFRQLADVEQRKCARRC